jgi:uncharacterized protein YodC (DUF2158 family)
MKTILSILIITLCSGCAFPRRNFTGFQNPREFTTIRSVSQNPIYITKIDDTITTYSGSPRPTVVDVQPGMRRLHVLTGYGNKPGDFYGKLDVPCIAYKEYYLAFDYNHPPNTTNEVFLYDRSLVVSFDEPITLVDTVYSNVNSVLDMWNIVPHDSDIPEWFSSSTNRGVFLNNVDAHVQQYPTSMANILIESINQFVNKVIQLRTARKVPASGYVFRVYESPRYNLIVETEALYREPERPVSSRASQTTKTYSPNNYVPTYTPYIPPPQIYQPPQIHIPPPIAPIAPSYTPPSSIYNSPVYRLP